MLYKQSPLGQTVHYPSTYDSSLLFPILRQQARQSLQLPDTLPFTGVDRWTAFELSWLNLKGKPEIALATFSFPCTSPYLIESKSLKLYLNSFNQTPFSSYNDVQDCLKNDLSQAAQAPVNVTLFPPHTFAHQQIRDFQGICLDLLDIEVDTYSTNPLYLLTDPTDVEEQLYSHLFKSNCLVTGQPDWASILIHYRGSRIQHEGLLKYLISYRHHQGFHEQCVEAVYWDLWTYCQPTHLTVYACYTRRGGLDINPFRSNFEDPPDDYQRLARQ